MSRPWQGTVQEWWTVGLAVVGGLVVGGVVIPWVIGLQDRLLGPETKFFWYLSRASGVTAYLLLTLSMVQGLGVFTRVLDGLFQRVSTYTLHEHLSWLALGFSGLHAGVLMLDRHQPFGLTEVLVPFTAGYRPVPVGLGVPAIYGMALLVESFSLKPYLSHRNWRMLHYASFGVYLLISLHGMFAGTDTEMAWMQWLYLGSVATVMFFLFYRILLPSRAAVPSEKIQQKAARR